MASFLKRLFGGADKSPVTVASDSLSAATKPLTAVANEPSPAVATNDAPTTESMADIFTQKQAEFESSEAATTLREETVAELLRRKLAAMQDESAEQLKDWTCSKCGAPLPEVDAGKSLLKCSSCGTLFHKQQTPKVISGGVNISGSNITIGGDLVGGDQIVIVNKGQSDRAIKHITEC
ncbi:MAG: hypothetical protein KA765_08625 [Thermoflexales bacterium]|nr:hypothetical protein [Thermoflexales bacterium]